MMSRWKAVLDVLLDKPLSSSSILKNVYLTAGVNTVNHLLDRPLQGWIITRQSSASVVYDLQQSNQTPQYTLILNADVGTTVDILVF